MVEVMPAKPDPAPRYIIGVLLGLLLAFCLPALLLAPLGRDQGIYAWMAEGLLHGQRLYLELWDHKGPLAPLLYALAFSLFGISEIAVRIFDLGLLLTALAALVFRRGLAGWSSAFFFLLLVSPDWWRSAQPDLWAACFFALSLALARVESSRADFLAGLLLGSCIWIKPVYGLLAVPFGVRLLIDAVRGGWQEDRRFLAGLAGGLLPLVVFVMGLTGTGVLEAAVEAVVTFNLSSHAGAREGFGYVPPLTALLIPLHGWDDLLLWPALVVTGLAAYGLWGARGRGFGPILAGWLCIILQQHYAAYHYCPFWVALAWVAGQGTERLLAAGRQRLSLVTVTLLVIMQVPFILLMAKNALPFWQGRQLVAAIAEPEGFSYLLTRQAADKVAELTTPEDKVYLWGYDSLLFFLSHRQSASRYGFNYPLRVGDPAARRAEVMGVLELHPPKLVVVQTADSNSLLEATSAEALPEFAALAAFVGQHYSEVWRNDGFILYQRN